MNMDMPMHEGFAVAPLRRLDIVATASHARRILNLPDGRINIPELLDGLTEFGIYYDVFDRHSAPVPQEVEACYVPEDRTMYIRDTVFAQMCQGGQRAVFTFGHELGHALLAHRRTYNRQSSSALPSYCNSEWQANSFSAEFTMPISQIESFGLYSPASISNHFGVSMAAARVRLDGLMKRRELRKKP